MNTETMIQGFAHFAAQHPIPARLAVVSIEMVVLAAIVVILVRALRLRSPRLRALLWLVVLAKPVLGLLIGTPLPAVRFEAPPSAFAAAQPDWNRVALHMAERELSDTSSAGATATAATATASTPLAAARGAAMGGSAPVRIPTLTAGTILTAVWLGGVAAMIVMSLLGLRRVARIRERSTSPDPKLDARFGRVASQLGVRRLPRLRVTDDLDSPALVGLFSPDVLVPQWLAQEEDSDRIDWLLRHELMHWKVRDLVGLLLRRVAEALFFFHPLVWFAGRRWEEAMELACDRALVTTESEARNYAEGLYRVLESRHMCRARHIRAGLCVTRTQIGKRIAALLSDPMRSPAQLSIVSVVALGFVALIGLSTGFALGQSETKETDPAATSATTSTTPADADTTSSQVRVRVNNAKSSLRALHTAIECYKVDWDRYPDQLFQVTTPIAYITNLPTDPFPPPQKGDSFGPLRHLGWTYTPDWKTMLLYSVGPDGEDQEGQVAYDPTNGTISVGDIVRRNELKAAYYRVDDPDLSRQIREQQTVMNRVQSAIEAWFMTNAALPGSLGELTSPTKLLAEPARDCFVPGQPLRYRLGKNGEVARVWSLGPDGDDDEGLKPITGIIARGETPDADLIRDIRLSHLRKKFRLVPDGANMTTGAKEMLGALLEMKQKDGRDNALIYYTRLAAVAPPIPDNTQTEILRRVLKEGWSGDAELLKPYVRAWQPAFSEMRAGAALDYAKGIGYRGIDTPVPNFLITQISAKMLCVDGRLLESQGKHEEAMNDYLVTLTMGRDFTVPDQSLINGLIGIAVEAIALKQVDRVARGGKLDANDLRNALERVKKIGDSGGTAADMFQLEVECHKEFVRIARTDPQQLVKKYGVFTVDQVKYGAEDVQKNIDRIDAEQRYAWSLLFEKLKKPYWEFDAEKTRSEMDELKESMHPLARSIPNYLEVYTRYEVTRSKLRQAQLVLALQAERASKGKYPASLDELVPAYFSELPVDPFSGKSFVYSVSGDGYTLHGAGPTGEKTDASQTYDPRNGTISQGATRF